MCVRRLLVPKRQELVADAPSVRWRPAGSGRVLRRTAWGRYSSGLRDVQDERFPMTVYYAFKQAETDRGRRGFHRLGNDAAEPARRRAHDPSAGHGPCVANCPIGCAHSGTATHLASSIVLVCRQSLGVGSAGHAPGVPERFGVRTARGTPPPATRVVSPPWIMAQAAIGPGMAVFSRYARVMEASGATDAGARGAGVDQRDPRRGCTAGIDADL